MATVNFIKFTQLTFFTSLKYLTKYKYTTTQKKINIFFKLLMCICIIMKHTLPRLFINGIASICMTAANTLQQLPVTRINFNS